MNDRQKRIKRITDLTEYKNRRIVHDLPRHQAIKIASYDVRQAYADIDDVLAKIGQYVDEKR